MKKILSVLVMLVLLSTVHAYNNWNVTALDNQTYMETNLTFPGEGSYRAIIASSGEERPLVIKVPGARSGYQFEINITLIKV
ncbi:MAG: hypothetical protein E4G89_01155 [Methanothrix sp.]|nr:MAG: hypothetical protein E4G89_01155 [Methanothrix sp.]